MSAWQVLSPYESLKKKSLFLFPLAKNGIISRTWKSVYKLYKHSNAPYATMWCKLQLLSISIVERREYEKGVLKVRYQNYVINNTLT